MLSVLSRTAKTFENDYVYQSNLAIRYDAN
jgi:hypothetical protein